MVRKQKDINVEPIYKLAFTIDIKEEHFSFAELKRYISEHVPENIVDEDIRLEFEVETEWDYDYYYAVGDMKVYYKVK